MATKRQIYICCHIVIDGYLYSEKTPPSIEKLAKEAVPYGARWVVTYQECLDMLKTPLFKVMG
jgi:hypothetical protein